MRTAIVVKGYPRLSETFVAQEIFELEKRGLDIDIFSLRLPTESKVHTVHQQIAANVKYLPEYLYREPLRVMGSWAKIRKKPNYGPVLRLWLRDLFRDFSASRIRRFGQAMVLANELSDDVGHLYAHFLHTPATVARYTALLRNIPWSVSAHAIDIWTIPKWEIEEKLNDCEWLVSCTKRNIEYLKHLARNPNIIHLVYHGCDLNRFSSASKRVSKPPIIRILSVGRAVEKKGHSDVLDALALLPQHLNWTFEHIGDGEQLISLKRKAAGYGFANLCRWRGPCSQNEVIEAYRDADIFILASKVARNGDRDGLPNVLIEAQSQGLPCISTNLSGILECITNEVTGLTVEPGDVQALSQCLKRLILSRELREEIGLAARRSVEEKFNFVTCIKPLADLFKLKSGTNARSVT